MSNRTTAFDIRLTRYESVHGREISGPYRIYAADFFDASERTQFACRMAALADPSRTYQVYSIQHGQMSGVHNTDPHFIWGMEDDTNADT